MISTMSRARRIGWILLLLIVVGLNAFWWQQPLVGIVSFLLWIDAVAGGWGSFFLPEESRLAQWIAGAAGSVSLFGILGSGVYYFGTVRILPVFACLVIVSSLSALVEYKKYQKTTDEEIEMGGRPRRVAPTAIMIAIAVCLVAWWQTILPISITESIRSPWLVVPIGILITAALAGTLLYALAAGRSAWTPFAIAATLFSCIAIAMTVYPLGFGFDPFLHQATVQHIIEFGSITPKPLYYIGSYALEFGGVLLFSWPLVLLDHLMLPLLGSLLLTGSAWIGFTRTFKTHGPAALIVFFFPLAALTVTTPQSLAYVITASIVFFSLPFLNQTETRLPKFFLCLLAAYALLIHPLAGIPAALYVAIVLAQTMDTARIRTIFTLTGSVIFALAVPAVFLAQAISGSLPIHFDLSGLTWSNLQLPFFFHNGFHPFFDGLYLIIDNTWWLLLLVALAGWFFQMRHYPTDRLRRSIPLLAAIACFVSFLLMHTLSFDFLIEYERADYADRLITLFLIFLLPHAGYALGALDETLREQKQTGMRAAWAGVLGCIIAAQTYGAYPRHDNYSRSAGFNIGQNAFSAVRSIDERAEANQYIVLSDQSLSAAAVQTYGFAQYFHGDLFYYPIPTGGKMYQYYLDMTKEPTREIMSEAMKTTGVNTSFFAVNKYWWDSERIIEHAKLEADDWFAVGDVTVFEFHE